MERRDFLKVASLAGLGVVAGSIPFAERARAGDGYTGPLFVFVNAETERLAILYRRNDGDYGLIEPSIGGDYTKGRGRASNSNSNSAVSDSTATTATAARR